MSRLTVRLPSSLHQKLINLAQHEGISLNQYIVYALTLQTSLAYTVQTIPETDLKQQQESFDNLLTELGEASEAEVDAFLAKRETIAPERGLNGDRIVNEG